MINSLVRDISREAAVKLIGDVFDDDCMDFYTDGIDVGYNDGRGTIWEQTIGTVWCDYYAEYVTYERHRSESPEGCWTEWEIA